MRPKAIGLGLCGPVNESGRCAVSPFIPELNGRELGTELSGLVGLPVTVVNDANAAGYGEWWIGCGKGCQTLVLLTLGTGVGGAYIAHGKPLLGKHGFGAEFGHIVVDHDGPQCACGSRGCLGTLIGARSLAARVARLVADGRQAALMDLIPPGATLEPLHIVKALEQGDNLASTLWHETVLYLSRAISIVASIFDPDRLVLAGGIAKAGDLLLSGVRQDLRETLSFREFREIEVLLAALDEPGAVGAAGLAWRAFRG